MFVYFRNTGQRPNVLAVSLGEFLKLINVAERQLQVHFQTFDSFVNGHGLCLKLKCYHTFDSWI